MHPLYILAFVTFLLVIGFGVWNWVSTERHKRSGGNASGVGGVNDPLSGTTDNHIRTGAEIRASLDAAYTRPARGAR